jgi:hypothetical protein
MKYSTFVTKKKGIECVRYKEGTAARQELYSLSSSNDNFFESIILYVSFILPNIH